MTEGECRYYGTLWRQVCTAQGWNPNDKERRREIVRRLTGRDSAALLTGRALTPVLDEFRFLANDTSINTAMPAADRGVSLQEEKIRIEIHNILSHGHSPFYVEKIARDRGFLRKENVADWRMLSFPLLQQIHWTIKDRAMERDAKNGDRPAIARVKERFHRRPKPAPAAPAELSLSPRAALQKALAAQNNPNPF